MGDEESKLHPIEPPKRDHPDDKVRAAVSAAVQAIPGIGGTISRLGEELIPSQAERARVSWEIAVSKRSNENSTRLDQHEQLLAPKATLTGITAQLAVALANGPGDGMRGRGRDLNELCNLVPDAQRQEIEDAAFEMHSYGLVEITRAIGKNWWLHLCQNFYEQLDHTVMGWKTEDDAVVLAQMLIDNNALRRTAALHEASGWDKRRFNPAFSYLLRFFPEGRISREVQPHYPSSSLAILPEDRANLRRFITSKIGP